MMKGQIRLSLLWNNQSERFKQCWSFMDAQNKTLMKLKQSVYRLNVIQSVFIGHILMAYFNFIQMLHELFISTCSNQCLASCAICSPDKKQPSFVSVHLIDQISFQLSFQLLEGCN